MKYYYLSHEGPFRNNIVPGKDFYRINREKNKVVITRINGNFHVLVCKNGVYEKEKLILSYFDLVNYLKRISFNVYFVNVSSETAYFINSYVKKDEEVNRKEVVEEKREPFYAVSEDNILKLEAYINRSVVKDAIEKTYEKVIQDEEKIREISLVDFIQNEELFELYHLPFNEKNGHFIIPNYGYDKPEPFYILSGIYNKNGEEINLSSDDLMNIYMTSNINKQISNELLSNVSFKILNQCCLSAFEDVIDYCDNDREEKSSERLKMLRNQILVAKRNGIFVDSIKLLNKNENKDKSLNKGV